MKQIFTLISFVVLAIPFSSLSQTVGGDGYSNSYSSIVIDGNMSDWSSILNDPDNNTYDSRNPDLDVVPDNGRDITRFALAESSTSLFVYLERSGSLNNTAMFLIYIDVNNDGFMKQGEPVMVITWGGSNGNVDLGIQNYIPAVPATGDLLTSDGVDMPGKLGYRSFVGANIGRGSADGKSLEIPLAFSLISTNGQTGNLTYGSRFNFHVSSINGNNTSGVGGNSDVINDNMGGSFVGFSPSAIILPIQLLSFQGSLNNTHAQLNWSVAENETGAYFEMERSNDGKNFSTVAIVTTTEKSGSELYSYKETVQATSYYRLKIVNKDKSITYSKIVLVKAPTRAAGAGTINLFQNPVQEALTLSFNVSTNSIYELCIYNLAGARMHTEKINAQKGTNTVSVKMNGQFITGTYIVEVKNNTERSTTKFLKQ